MKFENLVSDCHRYLTLKPLGPIYLTTQQLEMLAKRSQDRRHPFKRAENGNWVFMGQHGVINVAPFGGRDGNRT